MLSYFIFLKNELGQEGYHGMIGPDGVYQVFLEPDNGSRYATEEEAEAALYDLEETYGINRDEANIRLIADDRTADLNLGGRFHDDGISVAEEKGKRYIVARNGGLEASDEICDDVAERLVPLLLKLKELLSQSGKGRGGKAT